MISTVGKGLLRKFFYTLMPVSFYSNVHIGRYWSKSKPNHKKVLTIRCPNDCKIHFFP